MTLDTTTSLLVITIVPHLLAWGVAYACEYTRHTYQSSRVFTVAWVIVGMLLVILGVWLEGGTAGLVLKYAFVVGFPFASLSIGYHVKHGEVALREVELLKQQLKQYEAGSDR